MDGYPRTGGPHPTTTPIVAYDVISCIEANNFGKESLRMAGIVQMLHAHKPSNDKYPYAHRKRTRAAQPRTQVRLSTHQSTRIPGPCHIVVSVSPGMAHAHWLCVMHVRSLCDHTTRPVWPILHILLTLSVPSIRAYRSSKGRHSINS